MRSKGGWPARATPPRTRGGGQHHGVGDGLAGVWRARVMGAMAQWGAPGMLSGDALAPARPQCPCSPGPRLSMETSKRPFLASS